MRDEKVPIFENPSYVKADTFYGDEGPRPTPQPKTPTEKDGLYVDPRDKFRSDAKAGAADASASARWHGGKARAESGYPGSGFNGAVGMGLLQAQRGARLMYTPAAPSVAVT